MNEAIRIPGYQILLKIGDGSTSTVWRARQESLDREVAIKILKPEFMGRTAEVAALLRDARAIAKLKSHNIIQIYDVGQHENTIYFVMECVNGHPLSTLLDIGDPLAQNRALSIAAAVAQAMADAWNAEKITHRNLKPENIIIEKGGGIKVANLGMSGMGDGKGTQADDEGVIVGTPNYMSPEQAEGSKAISFASDMYSLGAVLYHMVTGQLPFKDLSPHDAVQAQIDGQLPSPPDVNSKVTTACAQLVARLMMKAPEDRYPNWESVIADIGKLIDGKLVVTKPLTGKISTIATNGESSSRKPAGRKAAPADPAARAAALKKKYSSPRTPIWLRLPLTAALLALFGWLGAELLWKPYREAYQTLLPVRTEPTQPADPVPAPPPARPATAQPVPRPEPEDSTPAPQSQTAPEPVASAPAPVPAPVPRQLAALKSSLVDAALSNGLTAAEKLLQQRQQDPTLASAAPQIEELARFFNPANQPEAIIAKAFQKLVGKETFVNISGRRVDFRVEAVNGDTISAMVKTLSGSSTVLRPAELKIGQMGPDEQRRWLGDADTPEKSFSAAVLDLSAANYAAAAKQAENCGTLSEATRKFAEQRISMLLE